MRKNPRGKEERRSDANQKGQKAGGREMPLNLSPGKPT